MNCNTCNYKVTHLLADGTYTESICGKEIPIKHIFYDVYTNAIKNLKTNVNQKGA